MIVQYYSLDKCVGCFFCIQIHFLIDQNVKVQSEFSGLLEKTGFTEPPT